MHNLLQQKINQIPIFTRVLFLPTVLLMLNFVDVYTTNYGLANGLTEMNPLFSNSIVPAKLSACLLFFFTSYLQDKWNIRTKRINDIVLSILITFYVTVVINNIFAITTIF